MLYLWASRTLLVAGCLLIASGLGYGGMVGYLVWREAVSPSTGQVLVLKDGRRIPFAQPTPLPRPTSMPEVSTRQASAHPAPATPVPSNAASEAPSLLPPSSIKIERIGVEWPVVLSTDKHLPRFKGVGWLLGSAYPGFAGNMVLLGHFDGPYSTFGRLGELRPGNEFSVFTAGGEHRYRVRELFETERNDVGVLAPTEEAAATLITCSGQWLPSLKDYSHRLVVTADYIGR